MASARGQRNAAIYNSNLWNQNKQEGQQYLTSYSNQAVDSLNAGKREASDYTTRYGDRALNSLGQGQSHLESGYGQARDALNLGRNEAQSRLDTINGLYQPYADAGRSAVGTLAGSLGLGGAAERQKAVDAFQAGPGYQFGVDEALRAGTRQASAMGRLDGGGTLAELTRIGHGLANQEYGNWQNRLQGLTNTGMQANAAIGANTTNQANLDWAQGQGQSALWAGQGRDLASNSAQQAAVYSGMGNQLANYAYGAGQGEANIYSNLGNSLANLGTQTTSAITQGITSAGQAQDAAKNANQQTAVNAATKVFDFATSFF